MVGRFKNLMSEFSIIHILLVARDDSVKFVEIELGLGHSSTVNFNNYLQEVCAWTLIQNPLRIGGPNMDVEIDESLFTRRKNHQGSVLPQQWVFGGYCRQTKECFMYPVEDRSAATLLPIITDSVIPGSNVHYGERTTVLAHTSQ